MKHMRKLILSLVVVGGLILVGAGCKNKTVSNPSNDLASLENEIQSLLVNEQQLKVEAGRLADQGQIKASLNKFDILIANYNRSKELNETIGRRIPNNQEYFGKRGELFASAVNIWEKTKGCIALMNEGQKSSESTAAMDCMQQKVGPLQGGYQALLQEVTNLSQQIVDDSKK